MTSIILDALFLNPLSRTDTIIAVSPSLQAALTPWLSTLKTKNNGAFFVARIQCYALSPTFRWTTALSVGFQSNEERQQFMNSDLCAPLFGHLKTLVLGVETELDDGDNFADFVLKFRLLENFRLILHPEFAYNIHGSELIAFYMRMFHSQKISQTLLISIVKSYADNILNWRRSQTRSAYADLLKQHKIIPFLAQKTDEVYRNDHGGSLRVFLKAIGNSLGRCEASHEDDAIDELVPVFDLIEVIVGNGDLLHPCFHPQQEDVLDPRNCKWNLSVIISSLLALFLRGTNYSRIDFMQQYGRTLLPQLADFIFAKYDGSKDALGALSLCLELFFPMMDDYFWADEVETKRDEAGLKKMLVGSRRLLQNIPFDKLEFVFAQQMRFGSPPHFMNKLSQFFDCLLRYCNRLASLGSSELKDAVTRDVASQLIKHNLLPLSLDLIVSSFDHYVQKDKTEVLSDFLCRINVLLGAIRTSPISNHLLPVLADLRKNFFVNHNVLEKILDFGQKACDCSEDAFSVLRNAIERNNHSVDEWSAEDMENAVSLKHTARKLIDTFGTQLQALMKVAKTMLQENRNERNNNEEESTDDSYRKLMDYVLKQRLLDYLARVEDFSRRFNALRINFQLFLVRNRSIFDE